MAWHNIDERRKAVKDILDNYTSDDLKVLAKEFGCSYTAIWNDIIQLKYGDGTYPTPKTKIHIKKRDNYTCQYCGVKPEICIVEHVVPTKIGGKGVDYNLVAACESCNMKKRNAVWIPDNIDVLRSLNPTWADKIVALSEEKRQRITLSILPSILAPFRKKYGRGWARRVEELIERDENVATYPAKPRQTG